MSGTIDNRVAVNTEYCPQSINGYEIIKLLEECGSQSSVYLAQKHDENFIVKIYNFSLTDEIEDVLSSLKVSGINQLLRSLSTAKKKVMHTRYRNIMIGTDTP